MSRPSLVLFAALVTGFAAACATPVQHGTIKPTRRICALGAVGQRLDVSQPPELVRRGDSKYLDAAAVGHALAEDARAVERYTACAGEPRAVLEYRVRKIEVGATRSLGGKVAAWTIFLLPTLGLSSIYPVSENRWITVELDATLRVDGKAAWKGEFARTRMVRTLAAELPTVASMIAALMVVAQDAVIADVQPILAEVKQS